MKKAVKSLYCIPDLVLPVNDQLPSKWISIYDSKGNLLTETEVTYLYDLDEKGNEITEDA